MGYVGVVRRWWCGCVAGMVLCAPLCIWAEDPAASVAEIKVEGLKRVGVQAALSHVVLKKGDAYTEESLTAALKAVWKTGFFRDVQVLKEDTPDGVRVVFQVFEKPSIRYVQYTGRDAVSEDDVKAVVDVKPMAILNHEVLKRNAAKIKDVYVGKGYYLAQVLFRVLPVPKNPGEVDVVFDIQEYSKVVVKHIQFLGNKAVSSEALKSSIQTREGNELSFLNQSGTYKEEFFQTDLMRIQALYYDKGYVGVRLGDPSVTLSKDRRYVYIALSIEEGPQYSMGKVAFSGELAVPASKEHAEINEALLRRSLKIKSKDIFSRTSLFNDVQALTDVYRNVGYAYANVSPNSQIHPETKTVDIDFEVELGEVVTIERIDIVGNVRTRDKVVRRELAIMEGDTYNATLIEISKAQAMQLGYFETVVINQGKGSSPDKMVLTVEIKERSTGTFQLGAGFSSIEQFIFTAQVSQNNFLGHGHMLSLSAQFSTGSSFGRQIAQLQFYDPYFLDSMWSFGMNAYLTQRQYRDFERRSRGFSPTFGYPITRAFRISAGYTLEWVSLATSLSASSPTAALANLNRGGRSSALNASLIFDTRDNRLFPQKGMYHELRGEISDTKTGSVADMTYRRVELTTRFYRPLILGLVLRVNASLGWVFGGGPLGVPVSERFFPGGIFSVRGFLPRALGPVVRVLNAGDPLSASSPFVIGGNKQAVFNVEIEIPIIPSAGIKGVLFVDAGNAYDDSEGLFYIGTPAARRPKAYVIKSNREITPPLGLYYSCGFGFRWFSPMGPLRFEWGIPITKRNPNDRNMIFEFTIGNFF
jgi:outer membrane protein insertion porin family